VKKINMLPIDCLIAQDIDSFLEKYIEKHVARNHEYQNKENKVETNLIRCVAANQIFQQL
jgi:hypothetical protein